MTPSRENHATYRVAQCQGSREPAVHLLVVALLMLAVAVFTSPRLRAATTPEGSSLSHVLELPQEVGSGPGKEVTVLLDESHLKLAILTLRQGTNLPSHSAPVPTTIQVLEGKGVIHVGSRPVPVSRGTLISLAAAEAHGVVPDPESDMTLLVHYLRGGAEVRSEADSH